MWWRAPVKTAKVWTLARTLNSTCGHGHITWPLCASLAEASDGTYLVELSWGLNEFIYFQHLEQCLAPINIVQCLMYNKTLPMIRRFESSNPPSPPPLLDRIKNGAERRGYKKAYLFLAKVIIPLSYDSTQGFWPSCQCKKSPPWQWVAWLRKKVTVSSS